MKTNNNTPFGVTPAAATDAGKSTKNMKRSFSRSWKLLGCALTMLCFNSIASAQTPILGAALTETATGSPSATSSCVNGFYVDGWTGGGTKIWKWQIATTGYTSIIFRTATSSSASGPHQAIYQWSIDNVNWTPFDTLTWTGTGCQNTGNQALPSTVNNQANVYVRALMSGATNSGGTNRVDEEVFSGTASGCVGTPTAGTITPGATDFCGTGSTTLTLSGQTAGTTIQWQSSTTSSSGPWTNVGTNSSTYSTGTITDTTYYQAVVSCGANNATAGPVTILVHPLPAVGTLSGGNTLTTPLLVGVSGSDDFSLSSSVGGGSWASNNTGVADVDAFLGTGIVEYGGTAIMTYTVTDNNTLCNNSATTEINGIWPNSLALYAGYNGTSTGVIINSATTNATASALTSTGFGSASTCGSGGLSGLTVNTSVTSYGPTNPHVYYVVTPNPGQALHATQLHAKVRVSGTGPTKARIAYSFDGTNWTAGSEVTLTSGSCGASANDWYMPVQFTVTTPLYVAIYPYAPGSSSGTFQVNQLEVYGNTVTSTPCAGTPSGGTVAAIVNTTICDSGFRTLELTHPGGVGITYQWQVSTTSSSSGFSNTSAVDTTAYYTTPELYDTAWYRVVVTCANGGGTANSNAVQINVVTQPHDLVTGTQIFRTDSVNVDFDNYFTATSAADSVKYISSFTTTANINATTGVVSNFEFPASNVRITRLKYLAGCVKPTTDTIDIVPANALAYYLGENGTSTDVEDVPASITATDLVATGFGTGTSCSSGGKSGLTNAPASFSTSGAHVSYKVAISSSNIGAVTGIRATVRRSSTGPVSARFAYRVYRFGAWEPWVEEGVDHAIDEDDCGYSTGEIFWGGDQTPGSEIVPSFNFLYGGGFHDSMEVAVFPFDAGSSAGTFQVNSLTINGNAKLDCGASKDIVKSGTPISGTVLPAGPNSLNVAPGTPVNTYWGFSIATENDPANGYFNYTNITSGNNSGTLNVVTSCALGQTVFAIADSGACYTYVESIPNFVCSPKPANINNISTSGSVKFFPNPATSTINVLATEKVNVTIMSVDGKAVLNQKDAQTINISNLANGVYFINAYNAQNEMIKTEKLIKQ
jgi:hypothetical protein